MKKYNKTYDDSKLLDILGLVALLGLSFNLLYKYNSEIEEFLGFRKLLFPEITINCTSSGGYTSVKYHDNPIINSYFKMKNKLSMKLEDFK